MLRHGPAQFQALVPGTNIRVHVVGERVFATRIESAAVDYRYAPREGIPVAMRETTLPDDVAASCVRLAQRLDLVLAGIDLMQTPDGEQASSSTLPRGLVLPPLGTTVLAAGANAQGKALEICRAI